MKIDQVLARHPWPWRIVTRPKDTWVVEDRMGRNVFDSGGMAMRTRDAILELLEAHVRAKAKGEASEEVKK